MVQGVIDIGNTAVKVALFNERVFLESFAITDVDGFDASGFPKCDYLYLGSTISENKTDAFLSKLPKTTTIRSYSEKKLGVNFIDYSFSTLGADRVANVEQAYAIYPNNPVLVIDAGTCITYDVVAGGGFHSYGISPGLNMRLKAMNAFTGRLPDLDFTDADLDSAVENMRDTNSSMTQSVMLGVLAEINDRINNFAKQFSEGKIVLTGGDAERLIKHIKISTFADPYWTLKGYNEILLRHI